MKVGIWESAWNTGLIIIHDIVINAEIKTLVMTVVLAEIQHE